MLDALAAWADNHPRLVVVLILAGLASILWSLVAWVLGWFGVTLEPWAEALIVGLAVGWAMSGRER